MALRAFLNRVKQALDKAEVEDMAEGKAELEIEDSGKSAGALRMLEVDSEGVSESLARLVLNVKGAEAQQ